MNNNKVYLKKGNIYTFGERNFSVLDTLDDGIYCVRQEPNTGILFLERIADSFHFGFKLYGLDNDLVRHVLDTYNKQEVKKNLGILLNGEKGTGKTVTAKYIANQLGLPVILCDTPYDGLADFLAQISHDCVFFFDEFEKNFRTDCIGDDKNCAGESLLSIMDGTYNGDYCHVFILTTNTLNVNDNLICRPSRIRYLKSFKNVLDRNVLSEFLDDNLIYKEYKQDIIDFVETLTFATIDIVKSIVEEINIHNRPIESFKRFFNVKEASFVYYIRSWWVTKGDDSEECDKNEFLTACGTFGEREGKNIRPTYDRFLSRKSVLKYKEGDTLEGSRFKITEIDLDRSYMRLDDKLYGRYRHIYFENINTKPNVYADNDYDDGYID